MTDEHIVGGHRIPALSEDRERLWAQVNAADFLTRDEKRAMLGVE
jgi:phage portal protein BeeE